MKQYYLMHMDEKVALTTEDELITVYMECMLPPYLKRVNNVTIG